jgi:integrase/recombinase XerD
MTWDRQPLERDELNHLLDTVDEVGDATDKVIIRTLAFTGMRASELAHMSKEWIDWQENIIKIPRRQECDCGECQREREGTWEPKTQNGVRGIPLRDRDTRRLLHSYFDLNDSIGISRIAIWHRVKEVAKQTDITKKITPHVLRHTYGTLLAEQDFTAAEITSAMGHKSIEASERYIQYSDRRLQDAFDRKWEEVV